MALTDLKIKNLKPKEKPYKAADGNGLSLLIHPNGSKYWHLRYRYLGKEQTYTIGNYPEISLTEARNRKFELRKLLKENKNPNTDKKDKKRTAKFEANNTFLSVAKEWHELNKDKWTDKYSKKVWSRLETYTFSKIGSRPISGISALEVLDDVIRPIEKAGHTETSHRLLQNCAAIFRLATLTKRVEFNPLSDLRGVLKPHRSKRLPSFQIDELPTFLKKLDTIEGRGLEKLAINMLLLTFVRQGELRKAKWEYFDFNKKLWIIPAELMKMRREHIVPLSKQTLDVLEQIREISGDSTYLFPTKNKIKNPYMNENVINNIIKELGYKGKMVGHGFRSLASTTLNEIGYRGDVIEKQLAHDEKDEVRAAYNRAEYLSERTVMMQGWADHINNLVSGKKDNKVVNFYRN